MAFATKVFRKTWNSRPKKLRIGPRFQGFFSLDRKFVVIIIIGCQLSYCPTTIETEMEKASEYDDIIHQYYLSWIGNSQVPTGPSFTSWSHKLLKPTTHDDQRLEAPISYIYYLHAMIPDPASHVILQRKDNPHPRPPNPVSYTHLTLPTKA